MQFQLLYITALLPAPEALRTGIVQQEYALCPLDHPVEIICPHRILVLIRRKAEAAAQLGRDKRRTNVVPGEHAFVAGKDDEVLEVQRAGFQRPHDLEALQGLSLEGDAAGRLRLDYKPYECLWQHGYLLAPQTVQILIVLTCEIQFQGHSWGVFQQDAELTGKFQKIF